MSFKVKSPDFLQKIARQILWKTGLGRWTAERFWKIRSQGEGYYNLIFEEKEMFAELPTSFADKGYSEFVARDSKRWSKQAEYITIVDDVLLEPERLLGMRDNREVVEQTVVYKHDRQYPYIMSYLLHRNKADIVLEEAILYDGSATRNYYHHFVNALSTLTLWDRVGLPGKRPVLINRKMFEQPFFQYLYKQNQYFRTLNWCVIEAWQWVMVKKLYVLQTLHFDTSVWAQMRTMYALPNVKPHRRVFLNRDRRLYGRYLTNEAEAIAMVKRYGFEVVLAEHLTIEEQAKLFEETEYLVALTGAGLIQQFFMNPRYGHVIEIMPANRLMPEYYWQAHSLGMHYYDVVVGGDMRDGKDYLVDVTMLEAAIIKMIDNQYEGRIYGLTKLPILSDVHLLGRSNIRN